MVTPTKVLKKWSLFEGDKVIWMILFFLGMISIIEVYSASSNMSYKTGYYWKPILQHASYFVVACWPRSWCIRYRAVILS